MEKNNNIMAGKGEGGKWVTINGAHVFVEDGQSVEEAMAQTFDKSKDSNKNYWGKQEIGDDDNKLLEVLASRHGNYERHKNDTGKELSYKEYAESKRNEIKNADVKIGDIFIGKNNGAKIKVVDDVTTSVRGTKARNIIYEDEKGKRWSTSYDNFIRLEITKSNTTPQKSSWIDSYEQDMRNASREKIWQEYETLKNSVMNTDKRTYNGRNTNIIDGAKLRVVKKILAIENVPD